MARFGGILATCKLRGEHRRVYISTKFCDRQPRIPAKFIHCVSGRPARRVRVPSTCPQVLSGTLIMFDPESLPELNRVGFVSSWLIVCKASEKGGLASRLDTRCLHSHLLEATTF